MSDRSTAEVRAFAASKSLRRGLAGASVAVLGVAMMGGVALAQPANGPAPEANQPSTPNPATNTSPQNAPVAPTTAPEAPPAVPAPVSQVPIASQSATGTTQVQAVVITGSRIARRDYTSDSPIVTLNNQALTNTANVSIEQSLNKLPEFTPDQDLTGAANTGDVQPTPDHSVGISTVSLRGLGPNRNLVLVDGRRAAPVNGELVVDVNEIPAALIDHVETITGGASATYGPDAVGGVVNFILKKNFRGLDIDVSDSEDQAGDYNQWDSSVVMGTNFADDKGNITIAMDRYTRTPALQKDHSFYTNSWNDPTTGSNAFFTFGSGYDAGYFNPPSQAGVNAVFPTPTAPVTGLGTTFYFNNGQIYSGNSGLFGADSPGGLYKYTQSGGVINGTTTSTVNTIDPNNGNAIEPDLKTNATNLYITSPLDRWSMFMNGHYDINEDLSFFMQGGFTYTHTDTLLAAPVSIIDGWNANIPYNAATDGASVGHPVPSQLATLLNSRANPNAPWDLWWIPSINGPLPPRGTQDTNEVFQVTAGFDGKVPNTDWTYELYGSHSESTEYDVATGDYSLQRYQALVLAPNWGQGASITGNQTQVNGATPPSPGFGAATGTCTSGFYNILFNQGSLSQDCINSMSAPLQSNDITRQDIVEFDMQGGLFQLPAGQLRFAVGADYRRDSLQYNPDILQSDNSFIDQVIGVYPTAYTDASIDDTEGYGELQVPVLANLPFIKELSFNPGFRYSSYSSSPGGFTYKLMGDWAVNDWLKFRGGYNLAVRAPNIGELYQGQSEVYGFATSYGDACSLLSDAPYGAGGAAAPAATTGQKAITPVNPNATSAYNICKGLMGVTTLGGAPTAESSAFYGQPQSAPGAGFEFTEESGNPNLSPEEARTYTAGAVIRSPFQSALLSRATITIDWYEILIRRAIEFTAFDYVYAQCLNQPATTQAELTTALSSIFCQSAQREAGTGLPNKTLTPEANLATIEEDGVDATFDWSIRLADLPGLGMVPGQFSVNVIGSYLDHFWIESAPGQPKYDYAGTLGPGSAQLEGTDGGSYRWRLNTTFGYSWGPASFSLQWRHLPSIHPASFVAPDNTTLDTKAYDVFDLMGIWQLNHTLQLRAGIDNLFDANPPTTAATTGLSIAGVPITLPTDGAGSTNEEFYDAYGRQFYVGLKARF